MKNQPIEQILNINPGHFNAYSTGLLQGKAYRALNTQLTKALVPYDLAIPEWKLLGQLYDHGTMKLSELAERLNVEAPLVTALIDKLEKKELVKRESHPHDKRAKIISATPKARGIIPEIEPSVKAVIGRLIYGITPEQLQIYILVLQTIVNNAE